jgi:hypothetical protein
VRVISNALLTLSLWSESLHSLWSYERYLSSILHGATDVTNAICCKMKAARVARTRRAKAFMRPPDCGRDSTIRTFICISPAMARKAPCIMCAHEKSFFPCPTLLPRGYASFLSAWCWVLHQPPSGWSFGFDSQTRGTRTRENRRTL